MTDSNISTVFTVTEFISNGLENRATQKERPCEKIENSLTTYLNTTEDVGPVNLNST